MLFADAHAAVVPRTVRSAADAVRLFAPELAARPTEMLRVAHLDGAGRLLGLGAQQGLCDCVHLGVGELIRDACLRRARRLILAHNHPSGDPSPSGADRLATRRLAELLRHCEIELVDHLIFARDDVFSFRAMGLL